MAPTIRIDNEVYKALQGMAVPFQDTPNSVLRRILKLQSPEDNATAEPAQRTVGLGAEESGDRAPAGGRRKPRRKRQKKPGRARAPKGSLLPESAYEQPILETLAASGGRAPASEVLESLHQKLDGQLKALDREQLDSGRLRWQNRAQFVRLRLVKSGDMKENSPRGVWEISDQGRARLQQGR